MRVAHAEVVSRRDVTPELLVLRLRPEIDFRFEPGQYATVGMDGVERPYSIVSAPHEPELELLVELVRHGRLTPRMWRLRPGDRMTVRPRAKGRFTLDDRRPEQLMIATVTGIAPFISMLRDEVHTDGKGHHFSVLYGASHQHELVYREELEDLAANHPELLTCVPTVSRPREPQNSSWTGTTGRVNEIVESYVDRRGLEPERTLSYACGHPGMIEDVKRRLTPRGFEVREERFWSEG